MLWSDPSDEPSQELRDAQAMLRRAGLVLAFAAIVVALVAVLGLL
ncbi:morphogenic membrane protein MmpB [Streptomyces polyrhachis]|uniref:Morphogenic membrane protein MmpB n=1 Tax=Streptomyces polyrhachis TaxID=1282885 RepID=A0ABW2G964_9ACTN